MKKRMLFVFNPKAGKGQIKSNLLDIVNVFNQSGYEVLIHVTQYSKDAYEKAKEYRDRMREEGRVVRPVRKRDGIIDQVIKVIRFNKNEE